MAANVPVLFNLSTEVGFSFQTAIIEDGFRLTKSANFNEIGIMGRSSPIITYANSSAITLDVNLTLYAYDGNPQQDIDDVVNSFLGLTFPKTPGIQPPTLCWITLGTLFKNWECVCTQVQPHYGVHNAWSPQGTAHWAEIQASFLGIEIQNVPARQYLKSGNMNQIAIWTN